MIKNTKALAKVILLFCLIFMINLAGIAQTVKSKKANVSKDLVKNSVATNPRKTVVVDTLIKMIPTNDSIKILGNTTFKLHQKNAHASYYADKFTGRRTASGKRFDNKKYTCAHRKLPFGTKLRVTSERTNKSTIVEVTDRGPFVRGRDIDLSKQSFMDIAPTSYGGSITVTIEIVK